jgi:hypothetical protein
MVNPAGGVSNPCLIEYSGNDAFFVVKNEPYCQFNLFDTGDFFGAGMSGIVWGDGAGDYAIWRMNGGQISSSGQFYVGAAPSVPGPPPMTPAWSVVGQRDFNGDGMADLLWRDTSGDLAIWFMEGLTVSSTASLGNVPTNWTVYGTGDLNGDGIGDLLWRDSTSGTVAAWFMNGSQVTSTANFGAVPSNWAIIGTDAHGDILWRDNSGDLAIWQVSGGQVTATAGLGTVPSNWVVAGVGDFNGDGVIDILWRDNISGTVAIWFLNSSLGVQSTASLGVVPSTWTIAKTGGFKGDGYSDILWIDSSGDVAIWFMTAGQVSSTAVVGNVGTSWTVQAQNVE